MEAIDYKYSSSEDAFCSDTSYITECSSSAPSGGDDMELCAVDPVPVAAPACAGSAPQEEIIVKKLLSKLERSASITEDEIILSICMLQQNFCHARPNL